MHQITLLGAGLGNHVLRPDRVYRTGVLSPMVGFRPGEAVMTTADRFTSGPYSGMSLSGLRGGLVGKISNWWQGVKARAAAGRGMPSAVSPAAAVPTTASEKTVEHVPQGNAWGYYGGQIVPMAAQASVVGPLTRHLPQAMVSAAYGQSPSLPNYAQDGAAKSAMMAWRGVRWPWG